MPFWNCLPKRIKSSGLFNYLIGQSLFYRINNWAEKLLESNRTDSTESNSTALCLIPTTPVPRHPYSNTAPKTFLSSEPPLPFTVPPPPQL